MGAKISAPLLLSFVLIAPVTISRCCSKTEAKVIGMRMCVRTRMHIWRVGRRMCRSHILILSH